MDINDSQIKYLYESFRRGTMRAASEHFNVAPSSISRQIAGLERQLGIALVEKGRHNVQLTAAGQLLVDYYRERMGRNETLGAALDDLKASRKGSVSFATGQGLIGPILIPALRAYRETWPEIRLHVHEVSNQQAVSMVCEDDVHFGVVLETPEEPLLRTRFRLAQPWRLVMRPDNPLASRKSVSLADLANEPMILASHAFRSRQLIERAAKESGVSLDPAITCASIPLVLDCVMAGFGVALLNDLYVNQHLAAGRLKSVRVAHPMLEKVEIHAVVRAGRRLPRSSTTLLDLLEEHGKASADA